MLQAKGGVNMQYNAIARQTAMVKGGADMRAGLIEHLGKNKRAYEVRISNFQYSYKLLFMSLHEL